MAKMCFYLYQLMAVGLLLVIPSHDVFADNSLTCKDPAGKSVDWFIIYKLPKIKDSPNPFIKEGLGFAYILPGAQDWQLSTGIGIDNPKSMMGLTLQPLFHEISPKSNNEAYILYNDQPPVGPTVDSGGHTKGSILTNAQGGFWLQHSVPHFPMYQGPIPTYSYPKTGQNNGQILHCLSLDVGQVDNVGNILEVTKPHVFNYSIPDGLSNVLPILTKVIHTKPDGAAENNKLVEIHNAGRVLQSFAKGPSFHQEIYSEWIAPKYQSELDVQSWLNGPHPYSSNCTSPNLKVYNIQDKAIAGSKFSTHNDHSKWAISIQQSVVCIGDLNRMEHQKFRGGTVNCFVEKGVWKAFKKSVVSTQPCPKPDLNFEPSSKSE